jgi:hypothetical protein
MLKAGEANDFLDQAGMAYLAVAADGTVSRKNA